MASSKIHLFKKSAIAAGSPNNYYLNPSGNLWKIASKWSAVECEDVINLTVDMIGIGGPGLEDVVCISMKEKFININVGIDGYKKRAGYADKKGMTNFNIEMNPHFLNLGIKSDDIKGWEGISRMYISKLNDEEINKYAERKNDPEPEAEQKTKPDTMTVNVSSESDLFSIFKKW